MVKCLKNSSKLKRLILIVLIVEYTVANLSENDAAASIGIASIRCCHGPIVNRAANNSVAKILLICSKEKKIVSIGGNSVRFFTQPTH